MVEIIPEKEYEAKHCIGHESFFWDVYRLLSHCIASKAIAALEDGSSQRPLSTSVTINEKTEISKLLVSIAAYYRVKYDDGSWEHGFWLHEKFMGVGDLIEDTTDAGNVSKLGFREACNKIIHAERVHFDGEIHSITKAQYLTPLIHLYGEKGGKEWKATLDVVEFCRAAGNVIV